MAQKKREKRTSNGERPSVNQKLLNAMRRDTTVAERNLNRQKAFFGGKTDPWVTIDNPNTLETNKRKIRVRMSAIMGHSAKELKKFAYVMKSMASA